MLFNNIPTLTKVNSTKDNIIKKSQYLKQIILQYNWSQKNNININKLDYSCFFYVVEFYQQVMHVKYSKLYIETMIRTIFITMENTLKKNGNILEKNYFFNIYTKLSKTINELYYFAKENEQDEFETIAFYLLFDECKMTNKEIELNETLLKEIAQFFKNIINIDEKKL